MAELRVSTVRAAAPEVATPLLVLPIYEGDNKPTGFTGDVDAGLKGALVRVLESGDFRGRKDETLLLFPQKDQLKAERVLLLGIGKRDGYTLEKLRREHPEVHWRGVVPRPELVNVYSAADVFVFPSRSETFGLVMLEAMACGTPVAAYPVPGPLDVVADSDGGVLHDDLRSAALQALDVPRSRARARAQRFDWQRCCDEFVAHLVPARGGTTIGVTPLSQKLHKLPS